jgi:hypothetical protein
MMLMVYHDEIRKEGSMKAVFSSGTEAPPLTLKSLDKKERKVQKTILIKRV